MKKLFAVLVFALAAQASPIVVGTITYSLVPGFNNAIHVSIVAELATDQNSNPIDLLNVVFAYRSGTINHQVMDRSRLGKRYGGEEEREENLFHLMTP